MTDLPEEDGTAHRDIIGFCSKDWNGEVDLSTCEISEDGNTGFCVLMNGDYVVHADASCNFIWVEYGDGIVKFNPADNRVLIN